MPQDPAPTRAAPLWSRLENNERVAKGLRPSLWGHGQDAHATVLSIVCTLASAGPLLWDIWAMTNQFVPFLIQIIFAAAVPLAAFGFALLIGQRGKTSPAKDTPYECGMEPRGTSSPRFSIKFYLIAMLFIIFDIEVVFFFPWAVAFRDAAAQSWTVLWGMLFFTGLVIVGLAYEWKKGGLDWSR